MSNSKLAFGFDEGAPNPMNYRSDIYAAPRVGLGIKRYFDVHHPLSARLEKICARQLVEVALIPQYVGACIIDVKKRLQVGELIRLAQLFYRSIGKPYTVLSCQTKCQFGLQRAFYVQMQLCFWHPGDIRVQCKRPAMTSLNFISYALLGELPDAWS